MVLRAGCWHRGIATESVRVLIVTADRISESAMKFGSCYPLSSILFYWILLIDRSSETGRGDFTWKNSLEDNRLDSIVHLFRSSDTGRGETDRIECMNLRLMFFEFALWEFSAFDYLNSKLWRFEFCLNLQRCFSSLSASSLEWPCLWIRILSGLVLAGWNTRYH